MCRPLTVTIMLLIFMIYMDCLSFEQIETTSSSISFNERFNNYLKIALAKKKTMRTGNMTENTTNLSSKTIYPPPSKILHEYLRCRQKSSIYGLPTPYSCPYDYDEDLQICWKATENGSFATATIEYDHGLEQYYDGVRFGLENCTIERFCQVNGSWASPVPLDIQCKTCLGDGRPVKFNSISIMIETMSLSLSLLSLTVAVFCMINVKRLHLPRNLLHMHLFVAFIFRSIVKLVFIHLIVGGYTRSMIDYRYDHCGNIEILSKSSNFIQILGCRTLSSLFWYTDAVAQTFIFCEAMFLFTALTSHLFRDRGCLLFVLWGWLSPLVWLTMWIASHIITDRLKHRSTCWLEADSTTYFYYFFYLPYAFYLLVNFAIFLFLVRLLYSKYQSNNVQSNRSGNRHLIKSILILIPLFGLHSLFVMWVFYRKNQGHTIWYYIAVIFKAVFGDLQGFFTSLIYFYFNTEIRQEVLRQIQRSLLTTDAVRRSSTGEALPTRFSLLYSTTTRRSISRIDRRRVNAPRPSQSNFPVHQICWRKFLVWLCPCLLTWSMNDPLCEDPRERGRTVPMKTMQTVSLTLPTSIPVLTIDDDMGTAPIGIQMVNGSMNNTIEREGTTCDTLLIKNENESDELLSDENDVTFHQTSFTAEQSSLVSNPTPEPTRDYHRVRSKSDEHHRVQTISFSSSLDNKSLR